VWWGKGVFLLNSDLGQSYESLGPKDLRPCAVAQPTQAQGRPHRASQLKLFYGLKAHSSWLL